MSDSDNNDSDEDDNSGSEENENDCIDSGDKDESSDVILAFIDDEEEVEGPATTRSGRDRCNCSMNCSTLIMPKTCVTVQYV